MRGTLRPGSGTSNMDALGTTYGIRQGDPHRYGQVRLANSSRQVRSTLALRTQRTEPMGWPTTAHDEVASERSARHACPFIRRRALASPATRKRRLPFLARGPCQVLIVPWLMLPRRRGFHSVPFILNDKRFWDHDAADALLSYSAPQRQMWGSHRSCRSVAEPHARGRKRPSLLA